MMLPTSPLVVMALVVRDRIERTVAAVRAINDAVTQLADVIERAVTPH